jgi:hypothetical protein
VSEFLSDAWLAELEKACGAASLGPADATPLVIEQAVGDVPGRGDVRYHIVLGGDRIDFRAGRADRRDVLFSTDYATAVSLARGQTNAQRALSQGRLRVSGDIHRLLERADALASLDDMFAAVRESTIYPDTYVI